MEAQFVAGSEGMRGDCRMGRHGGLIVRDMMGGHVYSVYSTCAGYIHRTPWLVAHRWVVWVVNLLGLYITHLAVGDFFLFSYFPWTLGEVHPVCGVA